LNIQQKIIKRTWSLRTQYQRHIGH